jgi:hypothetical protein
VSSWSDCCPWKMCFPCCIVYFRFRNMNESTESGYCINRLLFSPHCSLYWYLTSVTVLSQGCWCWWWYQSKSLESTSTMCNVYHSLPPTITSRLIAGSFFSWFLSAWLPQNVSYDVLIALTVYFSWSSERMWHDVAEGGRLWIWHYMTRLEL